MFGVGQRNRRQRTHNRAAFADGSGNQIPRQRRSHLRADGDRTGGFARNGHSFRIAAESRYVLLHPLQRRVLVEQSVIARSAIRRFFRQFGMRQEAEYAKPVADCDGDDAFGGHAFAVVTRLRTIARHKSAAEKVNQHRQFLPRFGRSPNVQVQAIFAHAVGAEIHIAENRALHASRAELVGFARARPVFDGLRRFPAIISNGRRAERNALETANAGLFRRSFQSPIGDFDLGLSERAADKRRSKQKCQKCNDG